MEIIAKNITFKLILISITIAQNPANAFCIKLYISIDCFCHIFEIEMNVTQDNAMCFFFILAIFTRTHAAKKQQNILLILEKEEESESRSERENTLSANN